MTDIQNPKPAGISRRTVTKGIAWSVPAMAIATATPAYAAASPVITYDHGGGTCKDSSNKDYYFVYSTTLPAGATVTVTSWEWRPNANSNSAFTSFTPVTTTVTGTGKLVYKFDATKTATQGALKICFSWSYQSSTGNVCIDPVSNSFSDCNSITDAPTGPSAGDGSGTLPSTTVWPIPDSEETAAASVEEPASRSVEEVTQDDGVDEEPVAEAELTKEPVAEAELTKEPVAETSVEPTSDEAAQEPTDS